MLKQTILHDKLSYEVVQIVGPLNGNTFINAVHVAAYGTYILQVHIFEFSRQREYASVTYQITYINNDIWSYINSAKEALQ